MSKKSKAIRAIKKSGGGSIPSSPHGPIDKPQVCPACQADQCGACVSLSGKENACSCDKPIHRHVPHVTDVPVPGYTQPQAAPAPPMQITAGKPLRKPLYSGHFRSKFGLPIGRIPREGKSTET